MSNAVYPTLRWLGMLRVPARPYALTRADADAAHRRAWDAPAIARFVVRVTRFLRLGFSGADADDLGERLHLRDVRDDDRHACVECSHLIGSVATGFRCKAHRDSGVGPEVPRTLLATLQRCPAARPLFTWTTTLGEGANHDD